MSWFSDLFKTQEEEKESDTPPPDRSETPEKEPDTPPPDWKKELELVISHHYKRFEKEPEPERAASHHHDSVNLGEVLEAPEGKETPHLLLDAKTRNRHLYLIGKTRTGKTTLLKNLLIQDMEEGRGVGFIDPHGDAALELLGNVPQSRINDVIYFDPTSQFSPNLNPFQLPYSPPKLTEDMISVFKMFFSDSWGPRLEHLLRYALLTLIADKEPRTVRDLRSIFLNEKIRARITQNITNQSLIEFWEDEFPTIPESASLPIINKLSAFLAPMSDLERIFSTPQNDLDFSAILNGEKIFIANLAKGQLGDEPSRLLGGFITTGIQQAALARASIPPEERKDFYFYVDEFQNYTVSSFETILSESAKYRLNLTLANQTLGQIPASLQRGIFGNVATIVSFQVSAEDAPHLRKEMHRSRFLAISRSTPKTISIEEMIQHKRVSLTHYKEKWDEICHKQDPAMVHMLGKKESQELYRPHMNAESDLQELDALALNPNPTALQTFFPDYDIRQLSFPEVDDFINLQPYHAFCRIERADNVYALRSFPAPHPNGETRSRILELAAARRKEQEAKKPAAEETNSQKKDGDFWV